MPPREFAGRALSGHGRDAKPRRRSAPDLNGAPSCQSVLLVLADRLMIWIERARSRHILGGLDDRMLRDIGADRGAIQAELQKPFWRR